jgi:outer membrane protein W
MATTFRRLFVLGAISALTLPTALPAQLRPRRPPDGGPGFLFHTPRVTLGIRGGFNIRSAARDSIGTWLTDTLTMRKSGFNAFSIAGDLGIAVGGPLELVVSGGYARTTAPSEYRNWVDATDQPITQTTTLETVPLTLAARWYLTSRGRRIGRFVWVPARVMPYVGVGGGAMRYAIRQSGSFVDVADSSIWSDTFISWGWTPVGLIQAGADYSLGTRVVVNADARYVRAKAALNRDFVQLTDGIDLSGVQVSLGLHVRI